MGSAATAEHRTQERGVAMTGEQIRLVVLFGGRSAEHDVSCITARHVLAAVDPARYDVVPVGIDRDGNWAIAEGAAAAFTAGPDALPDQLDPAGTAIAPTGAVMSPDPTEKVVVLPLLHGPNGEDGTVQGMLELAGVPYVGSNVLASALAMDKIKAKEMLDYHGILQAKWATVQSGRVTARGLDKIVADLGLPLFVKPANMGSSIGVSRVDTRSDLEGALELALSYDEWVIVEEAIAGREVEIGVLGNQVPRVSVPGEIRPGDDFYSYDDKYIDGTAQLVIPAVLPADVIERMGELAKQVFRALRCEGMARVDFFYESERGLILNEVNTIPGFTPISMYPIMWEATGVSYPELIDELIRLALERHERRSKLR